MAAKSPLAFEVYGKGCFVPNVDSRGGAMRRADPDFSHSGHDRAAKAIINGFTLEIFDRVGLNWAIEELNSIQVNRTV